MTKFRYLYNQEGLTLVEVLGSIVILSIIVTTFLAFFIHSARTTSVSEEMIDGLYIAQQQVEEIYNQSNHYDYDQLISQLSSQSDNHLSTGLIDEFTLSKEGYQMTIHISPVENDTNETIDDLYTLLVKIFDQDNKQQAQLETKFFFDRLGDNDD
ncbi:type IV pilus modification PilV family protein [Amphibacillus sp. Q70]|uniref:type IV pilus modification PilV family protein n=1 Tax=Amphibacillus sp. Q70 TaxID=3453416 RepID=UPI003F86C48B